MTAPSPSPTHMRLRDDRGGALATTLVVTTLLSLAVSLAFTAALGHGRFVRQSVHRLQAQYAAEAGLYTALETLRQRRLLWPADSVFVLPRNQRSRVSVEPFGGYLLVRSVAEAGRSRFTLRALVGAEPPTGFRRALVVWDPSVPLTLNGAVHVRGDVVVGERGLDTSSTLGGHPFTGRIEGDVLRAPTRQPPFFDPALFDETVARCEALLDRRTAAAPDSPPRYTRSSRAARMPSENPVRLAGRRTAFGPADSLLFREPVTLVAPGDLTLHGLRLEPGTIVAAGGRLTLSDLTGEQSLFFAHDSIRISGPTRLSGPFFSRTHISIGRGVRLTYPTVLYLTGDAANQGGQIHLAGNGVVDGLVIHPSVDPPPRASYGRIVIAPGAIVRGAVFNGHETEIHGAVHGALVTRRTYLHRAETGTHYVNWIRHALLDARARPAPFLVPLGFSLRPRLAVLTRDSFTEPLHASP